MRQILFFGDSFVRSLCSAYNQIISPITGDTATWRRLIFRPTDSDRQAIEAADRIVVQINSAQTGDAMVEIAGRDRCHLFPKVAAPFLWPFGGQAHPANRPLPHLPYGHYPAALGDAFLNRMIDAGIDPEAAARRYLELDVNLVVDLDRMLEMGIAQQRERDQVSGYSYADTIADTFRVMRLFASPEYPRPSLARCIFRDVVSNVDANAAAKASQQFGLLDFGAEELPIHPSVARHFNLRFQADKVGDSDRARDGCAFTDYVRGYLMGMETEDMGDGSLSEADRRKATIERLWSETTRSPASAPRIMALVKLLAADGQIDSAFSVAQQALAIEPENVAYRDQISDILAAGGRNEDAITILRDAVALDPQRASRHARLARLLLRAKKFDEAEVAIRQALHLQPENGNFHDCLGHVLGGQRRLADSIDAFLQAAQLSPQNAPVHAHLHGILLRAGRVQEAEAAIRHAIALQPDNRNYTDKLHQLLLKREKEDTPAETPQADTPELSPPEPPDDEPPLHGLASSPDDEPPLHALASLSALDMLAEVQTPSELPPAPPRPPAAWSRWLRRLIPGG